MWLNLVNSVPTAWTVYGVWITYGKITGFLSTAITAGCTALITYAFSGSA